ncbi:MAG TPA: sensor domain-containing diguanylate cyclase, partial [Euzebyales bacterium]|nr:sensor domain-containing diguanylate cyclase [Euzebyales bacterium]
MGTTSSGADRHVNSAVGRVVDLLDDAVSPGMLGDVLRRLAESLEVDELALFSGSTPAVLIAAGGPRVVADRNAADDRVDRAAIAGTIVQVGGDGDREPWVIDPETIVHGGLWVPAPPDAAVPAVVRALRVDGRPFPAGTLQVLTVVVRRAATALQRLHRQQFEQARDAERAQLFLVSASVAGDLDFGLVAMRVVEGITRVTEFGAATVEVVDGDRVRRAAACGDERLTVGVSSPLQRWRDALTDDRGIGELSFLLPLHGSLPAAGEPDAATGVVTQLRGRDGEVLGFLTLAQPRTAAALEPHTIQTVELFARQAQIALVNAALLRESERQRDIAHTLMQVTSELATGLDVDGILATCRRVAVANSVAERATLLVVDDGGRVQVAPATAGRPVGDPPGTPASIDDDQLLADCLGADDPIIIHDVTSSPHATAPVLTALEARSAALYPVRAGGDALAVLIVSHRTTVRFPADEVALLRQIATQAGTALRQSLLHEQTREHAEHNARLVRLTTAMTTTLNFEVIFRRIVEAVTDRLDADTVSVLRIGDHTAQVLGHMADGDVHCGRPPLEVPIDDRLAEALQLVWDRGTLRMDDVRTCPALSSIARSSTRAAVLAAPANRAETNVLLTVSSRATAACGSAEERFLADLVRVTRLAVRNADLFDEVLESARRDPLTGLLNRRVFWSTLQDHLRRLSSQETLALAVIDADDFKQINDRHGHAVGDVALQHIATQLEGTVRDDDRVFRIGGEEFTVIMPTASAERAYRMLRRSMRAVSARRVDLPPLSISAGVAVAPFDGTTADALFGEADRALLSAKRHGKNRVEL